MIATPRIMLNVFALMPPMYQAVAQHAEHEGAEEGADDGAGPAGEGGAADDGGGDAVEHQLRAARQGVERGIRIPSLIPVNPASVAASMKLPTLIRFVCTPASRAPIGLPPVATV